MGKYCLHFHHAGQCADCVFMGNTIYELLGSTGRLAFTVAPSMVCVVVLVLPEKKHSAMFRKGFMRHSKVSSQGQPRLASLSMVPTDLWSRVTFCGTLALPEFTQKMAMRCSIH